MRHRTEGHARVTNIELFFDLVYVFAVTQLSHHLLPHPTADGALQTALLVAMVWLLWAYTTWVTNWLDPERIPVRLLLLALMLIALVMSAALPRAFGNSGLLIGLAYAVMQIGRSLFAIWALRGHPLMRNFQRILAWCCVSGALAVVGGLTATVYRERCSGCWRSALTWWAAWSGSTRPASAGRARRSGTSRAATSQSGARVSS